jgi:hypothetical protein
MARLKTWEMFGVECWHVRFSTHVTYCAPLETLIFVYVYSLFLLSCACSGLATGWSPVQGIPPTLYKIKKFEVKRNVSRISYAPEGAIGIWYWGKTTNQSSKIIKRVSTGTRVIGSITVDEPYKMSHNLFMRCDACLQAEDGQFQDLL